MRSLVSNSIYAKKGQKWPSQCQPPPPVPPFLLTQNLRPKDIAGSLRCLD